MFFSCILPVRRVRLHIQTLLFDITFLFNIFFYSFWVFLNVINFQYHLLNETTGEGEREIERECVKRTENKKERKCTKENLYMRDAIDRQQQQRTDSLACL